MLGEVVSRPHHEGAFLVRSNADAARHGNERIGRVERRSVVLYVQLRRSLDVADPDEAFFGPDRGIFRDRFALVRCHVDAVGRTVFAAYGSCEGVNPRVQHRIERWALGRRRAIVGVEGGACVRRIPMRAKTLVYAAHGGSVPSPHPRVVRPRGDQRLPVQGVVSAKAEEVLSFRHSKEVAHPLVHAASLYAREINVEAALLYDPEPRAVQAKEAHVVQVGERVYVCGGIVGHCVVLRRKEEKTVRERSENGPLHG